MLNCRVSGLILATGLLTHCRSRTINASDFQSAEAAQPICYDLTETLLSTPPDRAAMGKVPIQTYHISSFVAAIYDVERDFSESTPFLQNGMFIEEAAAIRLYTERAYGGINEALYKRDCETFKLYNFAIASGLNKTAALYGRVYRGGEIRENEMASYQVGKEIVAPAFLSASASREIADRFKRNALFEIDAKGIGYIGWMSTNGGGGTTSDEKEVLIPPGSRFTVLSIEDMGKYKLVKLSQTTKSKSTTQYPSQVPASLKAFERVFKKAEAVPVSSMLARAFPLGTYEGQGCKASLALDTEGRMTFTVELLDTSIEAVSMSAIEEGESWGDPRLQASARIPELDLSLNFFANRKFHTVEFKLKNEHDWTGLVINQSHRCTFLKSVPLRTGSAR